jgi:hypothetical protein
MTVQRISSRWLRAGLLVAVIMAVLLAILLLPKETSGQDGDQEGIEQLQLNDGDSVGEKGAAPADLNASPYVVVGMADLIPEGNTDGIYYNSGWNGFTSRIGTSSGYVCTVAPIYLPDGATINYLELYGVDTDSTSFGIVADLYRKQYNYGAGGTDASPTSLAHHYTGSWTPGTNVQSMTNANDINTVVDNSTYHYYIRSCPYTDDHFVYGYRVYYTE